MGYELWGGDGHRKLGEAMFQLNVDAVNARYGEGEAAKFRPLNYQYLPSFAFVSRVGVYKALTCWLYQCSEGDVPQRPLFRFFDEQVRPALADTIISDLPEYERADWD